MKIGILGGGQLAQMLALAGFPLGHRFIFLDPAADACAAPLGTHLCGAYDDPKLLAQLADQAEVITYEFENVPAASVHYLAPRLPVYPPPQALAIAQDRLYEKQLFNMLAIETAPFLPVSSLGDLYEAMVEIGYPAILKTRTQGYDGKGQVRLYQRADLATAWQAIAAVPAIVEALVPFERELSIIAVRDRQGEIRCYPLSENEHEAGILRRSRCRCDDPQSDLAQLYVERLLEHLNYVGVVALEFFEQQGQLLANEFAPRVHNSGHWTQEGAVTSQFANHIRAISGQPLGRCDPLGEAAMVNFIGSMPPFESLLQLPHLALHDYGKAPRVGRKVGHANLLTPTAAELTAQLAALERLLPR